MKTLKVQKGKIIWTAILLCAVLFIWQQTGIKAYAYIQTQGTVTAESANIRKEADASSTAVASVKKGDTLTINNEVTGTDGKTWYYVYVNNSTGYILAELVEKKSSSTTTTNPGQTTTPSQTTPESPAITPDDTTPSQNPSVDGVTALVNVSATVTGSTVNVRKDANGISSIVSKVQKDMVVTITGQKDAADGKTWYQVFFTSNGTEVTGFIRSDYLKADGEIQPVADVPQDTPVTPAEPEEPAETPKEYDTVNKADAEGVTGWYLINQQTGKEYKVDELIKAKEEGETLLAETQKSVKSQKVTIIILVLLLIVFAAGIIFLLMKFKDQLLDGFSQERSYSPARGGRTSSGRSTQRRPQTGNRPQGNNRPQTVARPQGSGRPQTGARPQGGGRPQAGARPQGSGSAQAGARPQGSGRPQTGGRPQGSGRPQTAGSRPQTGNRPQNSQTPLTHDIHQRTRQSVADQQVQGMVRNTEQKWKSKNFMNDDDEFEFEFLNWDGQEEK